MPKQRLGFNRPFVGQRASSGPATASETTRPYRYGSTPLMSRPAVDDEPRHRANRPEAKADSADIAEWRLPPALRLEQERAELHDQFDALGRAVAAAFNEGGVEGGGWVHQAGDACYGSVTLSHPRGLGLHIWHENKHRKGGAGRRLTVKGTYPHGSSVHRADHITVSLDREPRAMARDIVRRFLPGYLATIDQAIAAAQEAERHRQARAAVNRRIEQILPRVCGIGGVKPHQDPGRTQSYWSRPGVATGQASVLASGSTTLATSACSMDLKLTDVPTEVALQILELISNGAVLEGTVLPQAIAPAQPELSTAVRIIPGETMLSARLLPAAERSGRT
ncbi:hypothetical protein [Streptomyces luteireticuli]|uniref:hypothetical protein n=1 Tax=Streptomyces luteireticuli TaxID=173858 RepID=UPI003558A541